MTNLNDIYNKPFLTVVEVASILGLSKDTVYDLVRNGELKAVKLNPKAIRVKKEDLNSYIAGKELQISATIKKEVKTKSQKSSENKNFLDALNRGVLEDK